MCPHCSRRYNIEDNYVGKRITCKGCQQKFVIENLAEPPKSPAGVQINRLERKEGVV